MSQFMVYRNSNPNSSKAYPYLLDVQSNLLESLDTRLVIPLSLSLPNLCFMILDYSNMHHLILASIDLLITGF